MAQSFRDALQKRIAKKSLADVKPDSYMVEKFTKEVIGDLFGKIGQKKILVNFDKKGIIFLKSYHSAWRSEVRNNLKQIKTKLKNKNQQLKSLKIIITD